MGTPRIPRPPPTIGSGPIILRRWREEDAERYVDARDEDVLRWTTEPRVLTAAAVKTAIQQNEQTPAFISMAITEYGTVIGNIALRSDGFDSAGEISYWLAPEGRGKGAATAAVRLFCSWAFETLPLDRLWLKTFPGNVRSQATAERAGFRRTGEDASAVYFEQPRPASEPPA